VACASGGARRLLTVARGLALSACVRGVAALGAHLEDRIRGTRSLSSGRLLVVSDSDAENAARDEVAGLGVLRKKKRQVWNGNAYNCAAAAHRGPLVVRLI